MVKTHIRFVKLHKWFPANDKLAVSIARLCILREDLFLELSATLSRTLKALDSNTAIWRKTYFVRSTIRTIFEIRSALEGLEANPDFREILRNQTKQTRKQFTTLMRKFRATHVQMKELRNSVGGHVSHSATVKALNAMSVDREGMFEAGRKLKDSHYRFAAELVLSLLLADTPERDHQARMERIFADTASLLPALSLIDVIFEMYIRVRKLA